LRTETSASRSSLFRFSSVKLLIAMVLFICGAPFFDATRSGPVVTSVMMTAVLIAATLSLGHHRSTILVAAFLVVPTLIARWSIHIWPNAVPPELFSISGMLFVAFAAYHILHFVIRADEVNTDVLCAGICGYLFIGVFWSFAYRLVAGIDPHAFSFAIPPPQTQRPMQGFTAIYFSFITLSTVGYGDIIPVAPAARMLAMIEAMLGTFYVAVMIARLVSLHTVATHQK
jgi:hypothetical protein